MACTSNTRTPTLSRAALAAFGAGTVAVMLVSMIERPTKRGWVAMGEAGMVGRPRHGWRCDDVRLGPRLWLGNEVCVETQVSIWRRRLGSASVSSPETTSFE